VVGDGSGIERDELIHREELQLALRNKAMPLEAQRYDVTPTGMHYTLIHYDIPYVDAAAWRLEVQGLVGRPLSLSLEELQQRPTTTLRVTMECAGDGRALLEPRPISQPWLTGAIGTSEWTGTPLKPLLDEAALQDGVREIVFTGLDRGIEGGLEQDYQRSLPLATAMRDDMLLAWAMNGTPLEPQHGYPLRLIVPGWYGMTHVKWLRSIEAIDHEFEGYQHTAYQYSHSRSVPGVQVSLIRVRSLMIPPGIPDFLTRTRVMQRGPVRLQGRAWSGEGRITAVDVSVDGGATWAPAHVDEPVGPGVCTWQAWSYDWDASTPGTYELCCRATDSAGNVQPTEQFWTARGMGNNMAHRVQVQVIEASA
jgi:DMSO/TMAO reductase YedYZ molybdopterin-dependent catalytic subunit